MQIPFDNSYVSLPERMFSRLGPTNVAAPILLAVNEALAEALGIVLGDDAAIVFGGNKLPDGAMPIAQVYAGHQFGSWNPQLGDGRAILLGEVVDREGIRRDIQLKGSGPTPYSRMGDGRAWLGPVMREYIVSEAMHAMGVPTTRALAAVRSGDVVVREGRYPGAVLTRVAQSHIRVGTFQYFAARGDKEALSALTEHVIARHYPDATDPTTLLVAVTKRQAQLIAHWMGRGFIHGVMNTDNASIAGETIDYGPCAFMDSFHPDMVFSSIDQTGRYAWSNQPRIAIWNMAQFATALIALMPDQDDAIESFTAIINTMFETYETARREIFGAKLGLRNVVPEDDGLIDGLLALMAEDGADFTNTFATLAAENARNQFVDREAFGAWHAEWAMRRSDDHAKIMARANPLIIPRNHQIEAAIQAGVAGDDKPFHALLAAVTAPYAPLTPDRAVYARPPTEDQKVQRTFCGT